MSNSDKFWYLVFSLGATVLSAGVSTAYAETITSPSYKIDGNFGGSFGGQTSSTSYKMSAIGGEAIVGSGSSGSYIIDQQQSTSSTPSMQLAVQPNGLVGYYPMDESTGTTTSDASRYQNNGTLRSPAAMSASGKIGGAIDFNGPNDGNGTAAVTVADHSNMPSGSQMTLEAWVYLRNAASTYTIATNSTVSDNSWRIAVSGSDIFAFVAATSSDTSDNNARTSNDIIPLNAWTHVVIVYDGSLNATERIKIYANGVRYSVLRSGTIPSTMLNSNAPLTIGGNAHSLTGLNGILDHVKLFNRALTPEEIVAEYSAQNVGTEAGLALGTATNEAKISLVDTIIRTNVGSYSLAIHQDHDLQYGASTIPAISGGSIASPLTWNDGVTKGLGFTLMNAPNLDSKWGSGASYAALPSSATTFYANASHNTSSVDVVSARLRLDTDTPQAVGSYTNNITYTGTMMP